MIDILVPIVIFGGCIFLGFCMGRSYQRWLPYNEEDDLKEKEE